MKKILMLLLIITGCSQRIVSYLNDKAPYARFETYRMVNPKLESSNLSKESSTAYELIEENITKELEKRAYQYSAITPDLTLRYELTSSTRVETNTTQSLIYPVFQVNSRTIHEAVLLLEITDQNKKLVWQGSYDLNQERKEKRIKKVIENAVARIFTTYPYKAGQRKPDQSLTEFKKNKE